MVAVKIFMDLFKHTLNVEEQV